MYEKRVHIRLPVGLEGTYQPMTRLEGPRLGITQDISIGGARFASTEQLQPGAKVALTLSLPGQGEATLNGMVVWSRPGSTGTYDAGLCWDNLDASAKSRLDGFLTGHAAIGAPMIIPAAMVDDQTVWMLAAAAGIGIFFLLWAAAWIFVTVQTLNIENEALQRGLQAHRHLIEHVSRRSY